MFSVSVSDMKKIHLSVRIDELGFVKQYEILSPDHIRRYKDDMIWYQQNFPEMTHETSLEDFIKNQVEDRINEMVEEINK